jgi:molybdate transport system substrate-binding protein
MPAILRPTFLGLLAAALLLWPSAAPAADEPAHGHAAHGQPVQAEPAHGHAAHGQPAVQSEGPGITTGAGYRPMLEALMAAYRAKGGAVSEMYGGHIGQMVAQIAQGSGAAIVVSDRATLDAVSQGVEFESYLPLGDTVLVLAWRKGLDLAGPEDLASDKVKSVSHPDPKGAIYGRAAAAYLESSGLGAKLGDKLQVVSAVPQVFAYLVSGEMDAGFVNRAMLVSGADKIGGSLEIAEGYPPISMVAAVVKGRGADPEVQGILEFLESDEAKAILRLNGLW